MGKMFEVRWTEETSMVKKRIVEANDIEHAMDIASAGNHEDEEIIRQSVTFDNFIAEEIEPENEEEIK